MFLWNWIVDLFHYFRGKSGKLVFIGLDNAGKTTLFSLLKNGKVVASPPTGQPTSEALVIENITLTTFDLGGHKQVRKIWTEYCPYVNAIVFIIDVADKERLMEAKEEFENILKEENLLDIPIVVLGNKIDKNGALSETETRDLFNIHKYYAQNNINQRPIELFMTSLQYREGYGEAFKWLVKHI